MGEMEEKLSEILNNPQMMQNIMSMAQSLGQHTTVPEKESKENSIGLPDIDFSMLQKIGSIAGQSGIDTQQKELLHALTPFLNSQRIAKLEKAMRAAKIAKLASTFLNSGGLQLLSGR